LSSCVRRAWRPMLGSSSSVRRISSGKRRPDIGGRPDPDSAHFLVPRGPCDVPALETGFENEQFTALMKRRAGLRKRARRLARLDDHGALGEGAHRDVALREEQLVLWHALALIAQHRHLRDQEMLGGDLLLHRLVRLGIVHAQRRADDGDRPAAVALVCAAMAIPAASPDTTVNLRSTSARARRRARFTPSSLALRLPTTAIERVSLSSQAP